MRSSTEIAALVTAHERRAARERPLPAVWAGSEHRLFGRGAGAQDRAGRHTPLGTLLIHPQITGYGSWVTSVPHMAELAERLARWDLHPEATVTHRFSLADAAEAYRVANGYQSGKVVIEMESRMQAMVGGAARESGLRSTPATDS